MKKVSIYFLSVLALSVTLTSCSKQDSNELKNDSAVSAATTSDVNSNNNGRSPATVVDFPQTETFYNECCGEEVTLNYNVHLVTTDHGWRVSLNQLSGSGSSGSTYSGANAQGAVGGPNNVTYTFSTTLVSSAGCVMRLMEQYHITVVNGNPVVEFDNFTFACH